MKEELKEIIKEVEDIELWGFEDCPQRFQVAAAIKQRVISIIKKHLIHNSKVREAKHK